MLSIKLDPIDFELHNIQVINDKLYVREGLRTLITGLSAIYGFSIESSNTTEIWHYIIQRNQSNGDGYISVFEEDFTSIFTFALGKVPEDFPVYYSVAQRQIFITSPSFNYTVYGLVGGGLTRAASTASTNIDTTALTIPTGLCCSFANRHVIAQGNILYFNDPVDDSRTFVAENTIPLDSTIYHLEQTDDGFLAAFCADSIYVIPRDALGLGQLVVGSIGKIPGFQAADYRCAASGNGITVCLVRNGIAILQKNLDLLPVKAYHQKRYFTDYVLPEDYRFGKVHKIANGFLISYGDHSLILDIKNNFQYWLYDKNKTVNIKAVLNTRDGRDLFLTTDSVFYQIGTKDDIDTVVDGYAAGEVESDQKQSQMVRYIHTSSANPGLFQYAYIGSAPNGSATLVPSGTATIIGTDVWSSTAIFTDRELRSRRHDTNVRTDFLSIEVGAQGSGRRISTVDIITKESGTNRPNV